jgi:hypothetical protein
LYTLPTGHNLIFVSAAPISASPKQHTKRGIRRRPFCLISSIWPAYAFPLRESLVCRTMFFPEPEAFRWAGLLLVSAPAGAFAIGAVVSFLFVPLSPTPWVIVYIRYAAAFHAASCFCMPGRRRCTPCLKSAAFGGCANPALPASKPLCAASARLPASALYLRLSSERRCPQQPGSYRLCFLSCVAHWNQPLSLLF